MKLSLKTIWPYLSSSTSITTSNSAVLLLSVLSAAGCPMPIPSGISVVAQTGASPNDALLLEGQQKTTLVVAASMDSSVQFFDFTKEAVSFKDAPNNTLFFAPNSRGVSPNPWSIVATLDGKFLIVSLFDDHSISLIDLNTRKVISTAEPMRPGMARQLFSVGHSVTLATAKDVLGDGTAQTVVTEMRAMHPTAMTIFGKQVFVVFTNLLRWADLSGTPSQYGPAVVARYVLSSGTLEWAESIALPCRNPADISVDQAGRPVVACSGSLYFDDAHNMQLKEGAGVAILEPILPEAGLSLSLHLSSFLPLSQFSPAKVVTHTDGIFLASSVKRQILFVPRDHAADTQQLIALNFENPDEAGYLASFVKWNDSLAFISDFRNDRIYALDLTKRQLNPSPFEIPLQLQHEAQPKIYKGPQTILRRQGVRSSVYPASDLFVVTAMSNEIFSIRLEGLAAL